MLVDTKNFKHIYNSALIRLQSHTCRAQHVSLVCLLRVENL